MLLIYGALVYKISDWDINISVIMAICTYITAPIVTHVFWSSMQLKSTVLLFCLAVFMLWVSVDGVYVVYHFIANNQTFRYENFCASLFIYLFCGTIWSYDKPLRNFVQNLKELT